MDWRDAEKLMEFKRRLEEWMDQNAKQLDSILSEYGLKADTKRMLKRALHDYVFFHLPHEVIGYYRSLIAEEGEFRGGFEELEQLRRIPYDNVILLKGDVVHVCRRRWENGIIWTRRFTVKFKTRVDPETAVLALRANYTVGGGDVIVVTEDGKQHKFNGDLLKRTIDEVVRKLLE